MQGWLCWSGRLQHLVDLHALAKQDLPRVVLGPLHVAAAAAAAHHAAPAQEAPAGRAAK